MKTNQTFRRIGLSFSILSVVLLFDTSCSKPEPPEPVVTSNLLVYTRAFNKNADRIDILIDGNRAGSLTRGYVDLTGNGPSCNAPTSGSLLNIELTVGKHTVDAEAYKGDQKVSGWIPKVVEIDADACSPINLGK